MSIREKWANDRLIADGVSYIYVTVSNLVSLLSYREVSCLAAVRIVTLLHSRLTPKKSLSGNGRISSGTMQADTQI